MRCRLTHLSRKRGGAIGRRESVLVGGLLRVGRNTQCEIYLADSRVNYHHAFIEERDGGCRLIAENGAQLNVDGAFLESVQLRSGQRIGLGPYLLTVEPAPQDCDLALAIELARPMGDDLDNLKRRSTLTLEASGLSRRTGAWLTFFIVLALAFALPMASARLETVADLFKSSGWEPHKLWQPGATSPAHKRIIADCVRCHDAPYNGVSDAACATCHRHVTPHSGDARWRQAGQPTPTCASCHSEHKGTGSLISDKEPACRECHHDLKRRMQDTGIVDIDDFERQHPRFLLPSNSDSGLKFAHSTHLAGAGNPPSDESCQACHQPQAQGPGMQTLDMTRHCATCHALNAGPAHPDWTLPHATPAEVLATLASHLPLGHDEELKLLAGPVFKQTCARCHTVEQRPGVRGQEWRINPVIQPSWLPAARFDHRRHRTENCARCHDVTQSVDSKDVLIPQIATCRECHGGEKADHKLPGTCIDCHDYHVAPTERNF